MMKMFMSQIEFFKGHLKDWEVRYAPRECNEVADALPKSSVFRRNKLMVVYGH